MEVYRGTRAFYSANGVLNPSRVGYRKIDCHKHNWWANWEVEMAIEVRVPALLRDCTEQQTRFSLEATTLEEALVRLVQEYPLLRRHLYDEAGQLRQHVLIFFNDENIKWLKRLDVPLQPGDRLSVVQAVSGG